MKTALIFFKDFKGGFNGEYYSQITSFFENAGIEIFCVDVLSFADDLGFRRRFEELKFTVDNVVVFDGEQTTFELKTLIAEILDAPLTENESARRFLEGVKVANSKNYADEYALIPVEATVVPNFTAPYQGFLLDDVDFTLAVLPSEIEEVKPMCEKYVLPYFENKSGKKIKRLVLKYFGQKTEVMQTLNGAKTIYGDEFSFTVEERFGDVKIVLCFEDNQLASEIIRKVVSELKENIYAEYDTTLAERLFDVLKLKNLKLSTAESFTAGRVIGALISNPGASKLVDEGIVCYSNDSKEIRLSVSKEDIVREGAVSAKVAYQMALGLLRGGKCDVAIATTGIAGPKSDDSEKPVGLNYVAVGTKQGIHTYRFVLNGNREEITETAKNTALFLAIKLLKKI